MEGPDIEARAELPLCAIAEIENLELTDLVAEALSWPRNTTVNFRLDARLICGMAALVKISWNRPCLQA